MSRYLTWSGIRNICDLLEVCLNDGVMESSALIGVIVIAALLAVTVNAQASTSPLPPIQFTSAQQCRCSDIETCTNEILSKVGTCKNSPQCTKFLTPIGDATKIRACLDQEHDTMMKLEACVKGKVGPIGCSNDANPGNLTIPLIPVIETPEVFEAGDDVPEIALAAPPAEMAAGAPIELTKFLMCVDQCSTAETLSSRRKRSAVNCAFKLRCALSPPDASIQQTYQQCETELGINPVQKMKESCDCLKAAGVSMQCPV